MTTALERFPDLPGKMRALPVDHRGFPVPWFVAWVDGEPRFPVADARKFGRALRLGLCWVCGGALGRVHAFVIGPMCVVNRTTGEPPCHPECARFSARNCPFLTKPRMKRVGEQNLPCGVVDGPGIAIKRNPGATAVWFTKARQWSGFSDGNGGVLINVGEADNIEWYANGKQASREQVLDSITSGLPILEQMVAEDDDPAGAEWELEKRKAAAFKLLPA